jgi:hypothetical protein
MRILLVLFTLVASVLGAATSYTNHTLEARVNTFLNPIKSSDGSDPFMASEHSFTFRNGMLESTY